MPTRVLLIGLDGFDPDLYETYRDDGLLPNLSRIEAKGCFSRIQSTIPPFTYPAWSTIITGCNPGKHGIIDFTQRRIGSYDLQPVDSTRRQTPTVFDILSEAGMRVGAMGFPTTFPPSPVNGFMLSGFDSPISVNAEPSFCYPRELYYELSRSASRYTLTGIQEIRIGRKWHTRARKWLLNMIPRREQIAEYLLARESYDLFGIVFSESDTASHHFWAFHDPRSPRYEQTAQPGLKTTIRDVYQALDKSIGILAQHAENILIVSDHGFGGTSDRCFSINRILAKHDLFQFNTTSVKPAFLQSSARRVLGCLPVYLQERIFRIGKGSLAAAIESRRRLSHADLAACAAFSDELNYFPSVWLHDARFPLGKTIHNSDRKTTLDHIRSALLEELNPDTNQPLINRVFLRDELYDGPSTPIFPDLILEPALDNGFSYAITRSTSPGPVVDMIPAAARIGAKGGSMNGSHRSMGVLFASGTRFESPPFLTLPTLNDVTPTILNALSLGIPSYMDGYALQSRADRVNRSDLTVPTRTDSESTVHEMPQQSGNDELIEKLKRLGYL